MIINVKENNFDRRVYDLRIFEGLILNVDK